jgi:hypothetical protein
MNDDPFFVVPQNPKKRWFDVLRGKICARTHFIHCVMALARDGLRPSVIGARARKMARKYGYPVEPTTFSDSVTGSHLKTMSSPRRGYAERTTDHRWRLTDEAWRQIGRTKGR